MTDDNAEKAWEQYDGRLGVAKPIRGTRDWNDERAAFMAASASQQRVIDSLDRTTDALADNGARLAFETVLSDIRALDTKEEQ